MATMLAAGIMTVFEAADSRMKDSSMAAGSAVEGSSMAADSTGEVDSTAVEADFTAAATANTGNLNTPS